MIKSEGPGRPKYDISEEVLLNFRSLGYTWKEISSLLIVSRSTLWRRIAELGIREQTEYSNISDKELDQVIRSLVLLMVPTLDFQWFMVIFTPLV